MLESLFTNLQRSGVKVHITFEHPLFSAIGSRRGGRRDCKNQRRWPSIIQNELPCSIASLQLVWNAIAKSRFAAAGLDIGTGLTLNPLDISWFSVTAPSISTSNLRSLSVSIARTFCTPTAERDWPSYCCERKRHILNFLSFLWRAPQISEFELHTSYGSGPSHGSWLFMQQCCLEEELFYAITTRLYSDGSRICLTDVDELLPRLKSLKLSGQEINIDTIIQFCALRSDTLRKVTLENISYHHQEISHASALIAMALARGNPKDEIDLTLACCYDRYVREQRRGVSRSWQAVLKHGSKKSSRLAERASRAAG